VHSHSCGHAEGVILTPARSGSGPPPVHFAPSRNRVRCIWGDGTCQVRIWTASRPFCAFQKSCEMYLGSRSALGKGAHEGGPRRRFFLLSPRKNSHHASKIISDHSIVGRDSQMGIFCHAPALWWKGPWHPRATMLQTPTISSRCRSTTSASRGSTDTSSA
jgi:hypothetical protein